jgi:hypothetical protein
MTTPTDPAQRRWVFAWLGIAAVLALAAWGLSAWDGELGVADDGPLLAGLGLVLLALARWALGGRGENG